MRQKLLSITQSLRLPSICTLCNQFHKGPLAVCSFCVGLIKPLGSACIHCASPLPDEQYLICGSCIIKPPHYDKAIIGYTFDEPLRSLIHQFKYQNGLHLCNFLCQLMLDALQKTQDIPQCLIPVPMHPLRIKQRGFNQAALLTKKLARKLKIPYDLTSCQKRINTAPQASLDREQRQKNVRKAFHATPLPYEHVAIIDDLLTTGNTANELALALKKTGIKQVDVWCCARTVTHSLPDKPG
ncbi:ComF family protein [Legionella quateirensis]|uniref:Competence protein ComF n=1 Tax=Legionella quateirensis TaxID=45072 RepID=A0A378KW66_9GAMM|nr:competence protein ComF [Legionella quateirensis]STY18822.1 competence protein ComF [Legionella quateirensis]